MTDQRKDEIPLRECPFCGGRMRLSENDDPQFYFDCEECRISFNIYAEGGRESSWDEAFRRINTRPATLTPDQVVTVRRALDSALKAVKGSYWKDRYIKEALALLPQGEKK